MALGQRWWVENFMIWTRVCKCYFRAEFTHQVTTEYVNNVFQNFKGFVFLVIDWRICKMW